MSRTLSLSDTGFSLKGSVFLESLFILKFILVLPVSVQNSFPLESLSWLSELSVRCVHFCFDINCALTKSRFTWLCLPKTCFHIKKICVSWETKVVDINNVSLRDRIVPSILYSLRLFDHGRERKKHLSKLSHTHSDTCTCSQADNWENKFHKIGSRMISL